MKTTDYTPATIADIKRLKELLNTSQYHYNQRYASHVVELPNSPLGYDLNKVLGFPDSASKNLIVRPAVVSGAEHNNFYTYTGYDPKNGGYKYELNKGAEEKLKEKPFFVIAQFINSNSAPFKTTDELDNLAATAKNPVFLGEAVYRHNGYYGSNYVSGDLGHCNIAVTVTHDDHEFIMVLPFNVAERIFGLEITEDMKLRLKNGQETDCPELEKILKNLNHNYYSGYKSVLVNKFDFTFGSITAAESKIGMGKKNLNRLLKCLVKKGWQMEQPGKLSGIKKTWDRLVPVMAEVMHENPIAFCAYRSFASECNKSIDGVKISVIFNDVFDKITDKDGFIKALKEFYVSNDDNDLLLGSDKLEDCVKKLSIYKAKRKEVLKAQAGRAFAKIQQEAENLSIDKKKYKLTWAKIEAGELAISTFFRKSEQYFLLNDNWDLWEEMFKRGYGDKAIELANEVKGRTTYEKDLMSYFYFVLYGLPEYLKRHTGHKWTCIPKLVNSQSELDPPKEGDNGIARQRSALTPIVDNERHTVEVPYASLAIGGGFGTTYCYSHDYHVLSKGFSFHGYAITNEIEKGLNSRDDYGLMFYTLTGSAQGRGYPTFLIIFERRTQKGDTKVHFHRTHPFRSKDGDYNPIHNWIKGCYNWMAGNIKRDLIKAQQGDLFFVQVKTDASDEEGTLVKGLAFDHKVEQYDKHCFEEPVAFSEYTKAAKSNILGYVKLDKEMWLKHTEHDDVKIPAGTYAIHQCRSWEANPKGVWSLRID